MSEFEFAQFLYGKAIGKCHLCPAENICGEHKGNTCDEIIFLWLESEAEDETD